VRLLHRLFLGILLSCAGQAATILSFSWNNLPLGDYYLDIQMASGDGLPGNNSASIKNVTSQNLTFGGPALLNGWASEPHPLEFQISDDDPSLAPVPDVFNAILLPFAIAAGGPGGFQMELSLSNLFSGAGLQDSLTIAILNDSFFSIYEENGIGLPMLTALFDGDGEPEFIVNASNVAPYDTVAAPQVEESAIPEPSTWVGAVTALAVLALWRKRRSAAALIVCAIAVPAGAQQAWIVQDVNLSFGGYTVIRNNSLVQHGNDIVFAGLSSNASEQTVGLYKYNRISRRGARFATLPVAVDGLASASSGLLIQTESLSGLGSLWVSDGTSSGTKPVLSNVNVLSRKIRLPNGVVLFSAQFPISGSAELWRSDGTVAGTYRLVQQTSISSGLVFNGQGYFINGGGLWKSDGTVQGTGPALAGVAGLDSVGLNVLIERAGLLYFIGCQTATGCEFWSTNGTPAGTQLAAEVVSGSGSPAGVRTLGVFNNLIFFTFFDPSTGSEIWKTDGTTAGTGLVKEIVPGPSSFSVFEGAALNNALVLTVNDGTLWRSDGSEAGTYSLGNGTGKMARISNGVALFTAQTTAEGIELWRTDGTLGGTYLVKDVNSGPSHGVGQLYGFNGQAFFNGSAEPAGTELWESDGTLSGTKLAFDFTKPNGGISPQALVSMGGTQYFPAAGNQTCDIYRTDGTKAGTLLSASVPGSCLHLTSFDSLLTFGVLSGTGPQIWKTNGTQQGTSKIGDLPNLEIGPAVRSGDRVYFEQAGFTSNGWQRTLSVTDGVSVTELASRPAPFFPLFSSPETAPFGQRSLLFAGGNALDEIELYSSDGTVQGTGLLVNLDPAGSAAPRGFLNFNGMVYFTATVGGAGKLFRSNGTAQGTIALADLPNGAYGPFPSDGNTTDLFLPGAQSGLLRYNTSTNQLTSLSVYSPSNLFVTRSGITYFVGDTQGVGTGIFRTDGSAAGTYSLGDIDPATQFGPQIFGMFWLGGHLYFSAGVGGQFELWRTNGVSAPVNAWQINPWTASQQSLDQFGFPLNMGSFPQMLGLLSNTQALIAADDGVRGRELWALDDAPCSPAPDLSSQLTITAPAPSINRLTGRAVQTVRIVNNGAALNNVAYIASGLNPQHDIYNRHGLTQCFAPAGPYRDLGSIAAGQTLTLVLEFVMKPGVPFSYTPKVIAREGAR
jgi:ELWxxDGT repeat protein